MEGQVGPQVAAPIFIHQALPGRFCEAPPMSKKRDLSWQNGNFQQHQPQLLQLHQQQQQQMLLNSGFQNPKGHWNPKAWEWDSMRFVAKPSTEEVVDGLRLGPAEVEQKKKDEETLKNTKTSADEDGENLTLKLGGGSYSAEETVARPNKRVRSGSPGGAGSYPMCQVDDCKDDLSNAKDYHRRHKVCELHSKTTRALVGQQMQRFCQQCSRFHLLSEFDEGKRSCRRRLAGHNRRRRKTQPEDVSSRLLIPGNEENSSSRNLDIVSLLTILARLQGNNINKTSNDSLVPDKDQLIQILSKINSVPVTSNTSARLPVPGSLDLNISHATQASSDCPSAMNGHTTAPSTSDLLAVLSAALAAASPEASADAIAILRRGSSDICGDDKSKINFPEQTSGKQKPISAFPSAGMELSNGSFQSPLEVPECPVQEARPSLPLQLFSSSPEDDSPPKLGSTRKYFSSDSSNPLEERSPSSSPVEQKLFPLHSSKEVIRHERMSIGKEDNATIESSTSRGLSASLELFKRPNGRADNGGASSNILYQAGYTSSSGSDHSPSTSISDGQDRTGRILFKLFDKDPSKIPGTIRSQIFDWLSHSPSEMESYIRPGCVVLSVYLSMPSTAWEELEEDLFQRVSSLIHDINSDFWRSGRFLIHTDRQLVSHKDEKIRMCKSWRMLNAPELISVSPLAIVGGKETSLVLKGRNLTVPGTKIHCTYMGGYVSKEVSRSAFTDTMYEDLSFVSFDFPGGAPGVQGRCFIEVENGFKGNSFPLIIADGPICQELRILESEFEEDARVADILSEDQIRNFGHPRSREEVLHFLNELGWLFQRKSTQTRPIGADFSTARFRFLLTFSVERDWSALVETLMDTLVEWNTGKDGLSTETLETLSEVNLLNRAVKRKCRKTVDLLLHYSVSSDNVSKEYLFSPNQAGPGGITPLHVAACTEGSIDMVDALTNDPQEIGLNCWNSAMDTNGLSPYAYASMRSNHCYNRLVARKLVDRSNGQVSITVPNTEVLLGSSWIISEPEKSNLQTMKQRSCAQCCAVEASRRARRMPGARGLLNRPYIHSMLAIAAVCVCVCVLLRCLPSVGSVAPFKWENIGYGWS